ncbi:hypothetical protein, conserved [Eimeria brunetti]|uniref:Uncharacterized protein n=1 Tax=Eimeria brunetti TaxID=51314 RepID=U6LW39_9EIME|nr:hypothetical protein, conserved [Eimeria brunetti]
MCLVQSEANLLEGQKLIEEQRAEIQRLVVAFSREKALFDLSSRVEALNRSRVEALNREKALVPPVVLTLPKHLRGVGEAQLEAISNKMGLILQALDRERQTTSEEDSEDRTSLALVQQRMLEEQQAVLKRLLEGFDRLDERFWGRGDTDEEPTTVLRPHKVQALTIEAFCLQIKIVYEPCLGRVETHIIKLMTEDELNRWSHALAYGGFLRGAPLVQGGPPTPGGPPASRGVSEREEEVLVRVSAPEGLAFDGGPTLTERHDGRIQYNEERNVLIITSPDVKLMIYFS